MPNLFEYEVTDCEFNQANYPDIIGKKYDSPPAWAKVKKIKKSEVQLIGLSYSLCVKAIAQSEMSIDDVRVIISGTKFQHQNDWNQAFDDNMQTHWHGLNPDLIAIIVNELRNKGMIIQPRNYRDYNLINPVNESATYGIWIEPQELFKRHFFRIKKALNGITDWGLDDNVLNQIDSSSQWLRLICHHKLH
jgi:hypothetical protein